MPYDPTKPPGKPGRGSKLTEELTTKVIELVAVGNYVETACAAVGISSKSYYNWIKEGQRVIDDYGDDPQQWPVHITEHQYNCVRFLQGVKLATAQAEAYAVATVRKHMENNWQAAMTYLERRYPGRWKRRDETTVVNPFDAALPLDAESKERELLDNPDAVDLMHRALEAAAGDGVVDGTAEELDDDADPDSTA